MSSGLDRRRLLALAAAAAAPAMGALPALAQTRPDPLASRFGGPFSLTDHTGRRVTEKSYLGTYMLVYFGFTRCTDACPVDMPNLIAGLDLISPLDAEVQPIFITVDPDDTPAMLKDYVAAFHPRLVGLTGSEAEIAGAAKAYRVHRYRLKMQSTVPGPRHAVAAPGDLIPVHGEKPHSPGQKFSISHGTLTYLMGRDGTFLTLVPHATGAAKIAEVLRRYVKTA